MRSRTRRALFSSLLLLGACKSTPSEPSESKQEPAKTPPTGTPAVTAPPTPQPPPGPKVPARPVASVAPAADDPLHGTFTLEDATKGIAGSGPLVATIETDLGKLDCTLYEDKAPLTVANFVGLAR